ncbi:divalent metal cation transporter, partial [Sulfolobus sp. A20-N-F6]
MSRREVARLFGPAWIALLADADAASIIGGLITGKRYGLGLVWFVLLLALPLFIV